VQLPFLDVGRKIDVDDLLDAGGVALLLGLSSANSVATYRRRYPDFPAPTWAPSSGRCQAWVRQDIEAWASSTRRR
jgi:predicted DNA-binding transcriptional regulator AlpA